MRSLMLLIFILIALVSVTTNGQTKEAAPANANDAAIKEIRGWLEVEYRTDYEQFLSQYAENVKVEVRDLHVGASGDLGYAAGLELISGTLKGGKKSEVWVRFTSLFRKSGGRWLDFHDHVSVPADIESGKAMLELKP